MVQTIHEACAGLTPKAVVAYLTRTGWRKAPNNFGRDEARALVFFHPSLREDEYAMVPMLRELGDFVPRMVEIVRLVEKAESRWQATVAALAGVSAWTPLSFGSLPPPERSLLVTNNLGSRLANGQMAMLWLVSAVHYTPPRDGSREEFYAYTREGETVRWLTHWRLAVPEEG